MPYMSYGDGPFDREERKRQRQRRERLEHMAPTAEGSMSALRKLQNRGWTLGPEDDLDAIEGHIAKVESVYAPMDWGSVEFDLVSGARQAVRSERNRRNWQHQQDVMEQQRRIAFIRDAARSIEDAAQRLEWAESIEDRRAELLPRAPIAPIEPDGMSDAELKRIVAESDASAHGCDKAAEDMNHVADVLLSVKDARFRRHAKTAQTIAAEYAEDASLHRARVAAARGELNARAERERMEQEANAPAKAADVDALSQRVAELESALADKRE